MPHSMGNRKWLKPVQTSCNLTVPGPDPCWNLFRKLNQTLQNVNIWIKPMMIDTSTLNISTLRSTISQCQLGWSSRSPWPYGPYLISCDWINHIRYISFYPSHWMNANFLHSHKLAPSWQTDIAKLGTLTALPVPVVAILEPIFWSKN